MAKFLKALSFITLVLGSIGSIIMAIAFSKTEKIVSTIYDTSSKTQINGGLLFGILVSGILASLIMFAILYGLSSILEKMEYHDKKLVEINSLLEKRKGQP